MGRKTYKKVENMRKSRCQSADSGVDTSLNNTVFQQVQSSKNDFNGLDEDCLDFEPEFVDSELNNNPDKHSTFVINGNLSLDKNESHDDDNESVENDSSITTSMGHRREMLPIPKIDALDGRQNEYFPFDHFSYSSTRTLIDSSSEEDTSSNYENNYYDNENTSFQSDNGLSVFQNFNDAGGKLHNEMVGSNNCDLSQEEEDKLLESSDDESDLSQDEPRNLNSNTYEVCRIGNACITLPTFVVSKDNKTENSSLKRVSPNLPLWNKKKKRWDLHFKPESSPVRLFLNDIGYIPPELNENVDCKNDNNSLQCKKLIVICNDKNTIVCEKSTKELQRNDPFLHKDGNFKLPLPPPKRPPTRRKRTVSNSGASANNLHIEVTSKGKECNVNQNSCNTSTNSRLSLCSLGETDTDKDDSLSIIASTIIDDNHDSFTEDSFEMNNTPVNTNEDDTEALRNYVNTWMQKSSHSEEPKVVASQPKKEIEASHREGFRFYPPIYPNEFPRIMFTDIPPPFLGLCYKHYFGGNCRFQTCKLFHTVNIDKFASKFKNCPPDVLLKSYGLALKYDQLFQEIYPCLIAAFGSHKLYNELTKCITDILPKRFINATEALEIIVQAFVESGMSFLDAIEKISFNVGFLQYPVLADILLDLITRKPSIQENWEVIQRIAKARGYVSPDIVKRILNKVTSDYPINKNLCLEIYNVMIKNKMTDISQISNEMLKPFHAMLGFRERDEICPSDREKLIAHIDRNLVKERDIFEKQNIYRRANMISTPTQSEESVFVRSYNYQQGTITACFDNNTGQSSDSDDRYFSPDTLQPSLWRESPPGRGLIRQTQTGQQTPPSYENSPRHTLRYEPPGVVEYVPDTVKRMDVSTRELNTSRNFSISPDVSEYSLSTNQNQDVNLTPPTPIFGNCCYRSDYKMDKSLHNLLLDTADFVNISEKDVARLNYAIKSKNGDEFYGLLEKYKSPPTVKNFITMTIAHLKSFGSGPYEPLVGLIHALESTNPNYNKSVHIKAIFEVIVMNILFELEKKGHWEKARKLLEKFCDWDSLISSQLLQIFPIRKLTHMGRYIYLAKLFSKGKNYHYSSKILQCLNLHMLEPLDKWPYQYYAQVDIKSRDDVLTDFFTNAWRYNMTDVLQMYRRVYKYNGIYGYDAFIHFNPMLINIINNGQLPILKYFHSDIDLYYETMDRCVLRAFTALMADQLSKENLFKLYEMCCERQIYTYYTGSETDIVLRTNMLDQELQLILSFYLEKILHNNCVPKEDVNITIKLFDTKPKYPKILQNCVRSVQEINEKVKLILLSRFSISVKDHVHSKPTVIELSRVLLTDFLQKKKDVAVEEFVIK
ncbi:hypothetical protein NQ317_008846 [Molorchus minor]|uniref:Protein TOPAZ1 n=1 Tax=Molorchus minor TaxID=1323400 RepID=A0ABQ9IVX9_9CUCU|nr:hypothetical protein NQ317_008846 [Molorchus minor]